MGFLDTVTSGLSTLADLTPFHVLSYGTLLGTELYQSFIMTKVCYQALPMSAFTTLQKKVFPAYFNSQSVLVLLTVTTVPPLGPISLFHEKKDWIPLAVLGVTSALNLIVYGPRTQKAMIDRIHQETRDGTKYNDPDISEDMRLRNRAFSKNHAMSIHFNLIAILATLWYGIRLGSRLSLKLD